MLTEEQFRKLEPKVSTTNQTGELLGVSHQTVWLWRKGVGRFTNDQLTKLEVFLVEKLRERVQDFEELTRS